MSWTRARARVAGLSVTHAPDDPVLLDARRELALERVEKKVRAAVESAPPLPPAVERRCIELIRAAGSPSDQDGARAA